MPTSGVTTGLMTARDVVTASLELLGVIAAGESLNAADGATGLKHLNWMLKSWQADGCHLWRQEDAEVTFAAGVPEVAMPGVLDVPEARLVQTTERPLARYEWGDFVVIPNKTLSGVPSVYALRNGRDEIAMRLWPVPNAEMVVNCTAARVIEDVTNLNETLDVPQAWTECVFYGLADRLAPVFGVTGTPAVADVKSMAAQLYAQMRDLDRPGSVFFQPGG